MGLSQSSVPSISAKKVTRRSPGQGTGARRQGRGIFMLPCSVLSLWTPFASIWGRNGHTLLMWPMRIRGNQLEERGSEKVFTDTREEHSLLCLFALAPKGVRLGAVATILKP